MNRTAFLSGIFGILVCGIFALGACRSGNRPAGTAAPVRVALLKGPSAVALAALPDLADSAGGRPVKYTLYDSPAQIQALMLRKEADLSVLPLPAAANLYNKEPAYRMLGCPVWGSLLLVQRKNGAAQDETEKELYLFGRGTTPDVLARKLLSGTGFRFRYTFDSAPLLARALLSGETDYALLPEPFASLVLQRDSTLEIGCDLAEGWASATGGDNLGFPQTALLIRSGYLEEYPAAAAVWDSLCAAAVEALYRDPQRTALRIQRTGLLPDTALLQPVIRRSRIAYRPYADCRDAVTTALKTFLEASPKAVGDRMPDERFGMEHTTQKANPARTK